MESIPNFGFKVAMTLWGLLILFFCIYGTFLGQKRHETKPAAPPSLRDKTRDIIYEIGRYYLNRFDHVDLPLARTDMPTNQNRIHLADADLKYFRLLQAIHRVKSDGYKFKGNEAELEKQCLQLNEVEAMLLKEEERTFTSEHIELYTQAKEAIHEVRIKMAGLRHHLTYQEKLIDRYNERLNWAKSADDIDKTKSNIARLEAQHLDWSLELRDQFDKKILLNEAFDQARQNILNSWVDLTAINDSTYKIQMNDFDRFSRLM